MLRAFVFASEQKRSAVFSDETEKRFVVPGKMVESIAAVHLRITRRVHLGLMEEVQSSRARATSFEVVGS